VGGDASVDLVNTVDWTEAGPRRERLSDYKRLTRWAEGAGVMEEAVGRRLRRMAKSDPEAAESALRRARRVRVVLRDLFTGLARGDADGPGGDAFAELLKRALDRLRLQRRGGSARHEWVVPPATSTLDGFLDVVVWSAARLLASDEAASIRVCAGPDCGWVFVDRSRNGLRRWCEMETCGTQAKTRRRRKSARRTPGSG
jgi:predicted RNA-binding Zn ribbon-like protein